jgi:hypothetical protein
MIWQFGELGYDYPLEEKGADRLEKKPIRWNYYEEPNRKALYDVFAQMIDLHINNPLFSTTDYTVDLTGNFKTIVLKSSDETAVAMANFDIVPLTGNVPFGKAGHWNEYFTNTGITTTGEPETVTLNPGEYRLYFKAVTSDK